MWVSLLVSESPERFGLHYLHTVSEACLQLGVAPSGFSLEVVRNSGVGKLCQEKSNLKEILWERKCMDFERRT